MTFARVDLAEGVTLFRGDALEVLPTLAAQSVDAVLTDPPYGIDYQSARRTDKSLWKPKIANDKGPFLGWGKDIARIAKTTGCCLIFYRWDVQDAFVSELSDNGWIVKSQIIWDKIIHGMGDLNGEFAPQHENILFARNPVFSFPGKRPKTIIRCARVAAENLIHPNEKPIPLLLSLVKSVTSSSDTVLDFAMGSGTTGVAAVRLGRKFVGVELDPTYFAIAVKRITEALQQPRLFQPDAIAPPQPEQGKLLCPTSPPSPS